MSVDKNPNEMEEIDLSELETVEEQIECCERMMDEIIFLESNIKNRISCIQTINNVLLSDIELASSMGEFVSYHYGRMNILMNNINNVISNLGYFIEGNFNEMDNGARGMYINIWYNIGLVTLDNIDHCIDCLEKIEMDIIGSIHGDENEAVIINGETIH